MRECTERRDEEWLVLQSIYPEFVSGEAPQHGKPFLLEVPVQLPEPLPVTIQTEDNVESQTLHGISHLPPLLLNLLLPPTYPLQDPPVIRSIQSVNSWLPSPLAESLGRTLVDKWANDCILDAWVEHIQNGDQLLSSLDLLHPTPKSIRIPNSAPHILSPLIASHNASVLESRFQGATHTCPICISRLPGTLCMALSPCAHVACRACLGDFWSSCIAEGDVSRVGCPDPACVKESRQASVDDVTAVVTKEGVERWQWLLRKQEIEKDPTIVHCPVALCQKPVRRPSPAGDGRPSEWDRLRMCECGFAFCMYCRRAWHGPHTSCALLTTSEFAQSYLKHPEGSPGRNAIERQYGRNNVLKVVAQYQEEQANRHWMDNETMACPGCLIRVQKNMGCNHMTCGKCHEHFCYRCGARLDPSNPYRHFNTLGHPCYSKLFDALSQGEDHWIGMEGFDP